MPARVGIREEHARPGTGTEARQAPTEEQAIRGAMPCSRHFCDLQKETRNYSTVHLLGSGLF